MGKQLWMYYVHMKQEMHFDKRNGRHLSDDDHLKSGYSLIARGISQHVSMFDALRQTN